MATKAHRRIEVRQFGWNGETIWEPAETLPWTKMQGPREAMPNWNRVRFDVDGAQLLVHDDRIRVVDNRS
jgi:hypothetical protein